MICAEVASLIEAAQGRVDYVKVVDAATLRDVEDCQKQETVIAVAVFYGTVRLIDNMLL